MRAGANRWGAVLLATLILALGALGAAANVRLDHTGLAHGPRSTLHALFEATIFQIDVLTVDLTVDPPTQRTLATLVRKPRTRATDVEIAAAVIGAKQALVEARFLRDVGHDRFLDEARHQLDLAVKGRLVSKSDRDAADRRLKAWLARIEERGFEDGDHLFYRVQGPRLRMLLVSAKGTPLIDVQITEPRAGAIVLASYLAPGHDLRELLIDSLYR